MYFNNCVSPDYEHVFREQHAIIALNTDFENYQWNDLPGKMDEWARSFLYRIEDISSYGNIMSTQNRFVKQNYVEKINQLRKQQRWQAPSHIIAKGTLEGAQISWRNEEPAVRFLRGLS